MVCHSIDFDMSTFSLRRLLPLVLIVGSSLAVTSCVVRERRPVYIRDHDRHHRDDHRDYDRH